MAGRSVTVPLTVLLEVAAARASFPPGAPEDARQVRLLSALDTLVAAVEGDLSAVDWVALGRARARPMKDRRAAQLCRRERETLEGLLSGASEKEIASRLGLSVHTVHQYVKSIYRRLEVTSRAQLMARTFGATTP